MLRGSTWTGRGPLGSGRVTVRCSGMVAQRVEITSESLQATKQWSRVAYTHPAFIFETLESISNRSFGPGKSEQRKPERIYRIAQANERAASVGVVRGWVKANPSSGPVC